MKKTRNAFFQENSNSFQGFNPMMNNMPNMQYQAGASSSFYAGYPTPNMGMVNDYEERLAKIERQINRLDHRISNLENKSFKSTDDYESTTNNMYVL